MTRSHKAGLYCRISDDSEGAGRGVARQEADTRALAERLGLEVVAVWVDNSISAFSGRKRPGYLAACDAIEAGTIDTLIADHPDRLHRSPAELEDFVALVERTGVRVLTVTAGDLNFATPEGRLMARITGAVARKESEDKQRRMLRKQRELRERRRPTGRLGYPYLPGGEVDPVRAAIVVEVAGRVLDGEGLASICADLTERKVPTRSGGKWYPTTLRVMLSAPSLAGLQVYKGDVIGTGDWPAVLDRVTWERVRDILTRRGKAAPGRYLLSGIARCGRCGHHLTGHVRGEMKLYGCKAENGGCGGLFVIRDRVDEMIEARMALLLEASELPDLPADVSDLMAQLAAAEETLADYARLLDAGELQPIEWRTLRGAAVDRIERLRERLAAAGDSPQAVNGDRWADLSDTRRRALIAQVCTVTVLPAKHRGGPFDPDRVLIEYLA